MADADFTAVRPCKKCGATERNARGGCQACARAYQARYRAAHRDKANESNSIYRSKNKDKVQATIVAWRAANPGKVKAAHAAHYVANRERLMKRYAEYRATNAEKRRASSAAWAKANPEARRINRQNREAKERANGGTLSKGLAAKLFKLQKGKCACCGEPLGEKYHLDHVMPIKLGGLNIDANIQLLRDVCNMKKSAKHPIDYMQSKGFLL